MSLPQLNNQPSDSEVDYETEVRVRDDDEDEWQDAEEQPTAAAVSTAPAQSRVTEQKTIDETELRRKIKFIQQNVDLTPREKAKQIQVCAEKSIKKSDD